MTLTYELPDLTGATHVDPGFNDRQVLDAYLPSPYALPPSVTEIDLRSMAVSILRLTGWSHRQLASALGTTHPTVRSILDGQAEGYPRRNVEYRDRLRRMHGLVERIGVLVNGDRSQLRAILERPGPGVSAIEHMEQGRFDNAYLAAIETFRPPRIRGLVVGDRHRSVGDSRVALDDGE